MNNAKKIKALIMLSISMMSLSGCSIDEVNNYLDNKYKIMKDYSLDDIGDDYYLVRVDKGLIKNNNLKIIGSFETIEEAQEYLNMLTSQKESELGIKEGLYLVLIGGIFFYCILNIKKDNKEYPKTKNKKNKC